MIESIEPAVAQRVEFRFSKGPEVRFISHLDVQRVFERAMRRARLPLAFSQGFNPHPRLAIYIPLPVGATGEAEMGSVDLAEPLDPVEMAGRLNDVLPPGVRIHGAVEIPFIGTHAASRIDAADYHVEASAPDRINEAGIQGAVRGFLASEACPRTRVSKKGEKTVDLRSPVIALDLLGIDDRDASLFMSIRIGGEGGARPGEVIAVLAESVPGLRERLVHRERLYRREP